MTPDTRSQYFKRMKYFFESANKKHAQKYEQVIKVLEAYGRKMENTKSRYKAKFGELKDLINEISYQ